MALADSALFTILTSLENLLACSIEASRVVNSQKPPLTSSGAVKIASRIMNQDQARQKCLKIHEVVGRMILMLDPESLLIVPRTVADMEFVKKKYTVGFSG